MNPILRSAFKSAIIAASAVILSWPGSASSGEVRVAVASNFLSTLNFLSEDFALKKEHLLLISSASTGKLYAQIIHGAPFDLFLAADELRPRLLEREGRALSGSRFTYAIGRLTLWAPGKDYSGADCLKALRDGRFLRLALANPRTAPYGLAARETLAKLRLWHRHQSKLVRGENIAQALQYVVTGNAQLGLIATPMVERAAENGVVEHGAGCRWDVPEDYHQPIRQQGIMLNQGAGNPAAREFADYLQGARARRIIRERGYGLE